MKYILRTYQKQAVEKLLWSQKLDGADLAILPTGSGKSIVIAELSQRLNQPILILQPTKEILEQNYEKLKTVVGKNKIGIYSASMSRKEINTYTLATIGSIYKKPEEFSHFNHVIVDECHLVNPKKMGSMYAKFFAKIGHPKVTGFTATPYRLYQMYERLPDGSLVSHTTTKLINRLREHFWHRIIFNITTAELIEQGHLVPLKYIDKSLISHASIPTNISKSDFDMDAFTKAMLKKEDEIIDNIFLARELGKHVLVFCPTVDMAEKLADIVPDSDVVTAKTKKKDRTRIIGDFRSGKLHTVFNVGVLTCLGDEMEILTRNKGWTGISGISKNDAIAQYRNGKIIFSKPIKIVKKDIKAGKEMVELNGRYQSFMITPTHNMLVSKRKNTQLLKLPAKDCVDKRWFIPVSGYSKPEKIEVKQKKIEIKWRFLSQNSFNYRKKGLPSTEALNLAKSEYKKKSSLKYKNPDNLTLDECRLIGFWLGDGCVSGKNKRYQLSQSKKNPAMIRWIDNILKRTGYQYSRGKYNGKEKSIILGQKCKTNGYFVWSLAKGTGGHKQHANGIYPIIPYLDKKGTEYLWGLNQDQYWALMEGLWKADGYHGDNKDFNGSEIVGATKELFNLLQAIGICRGFRVTIKKIKKRKHNKKQLYKISLTKKTRHQMSNNRMQFTKAKKNSQVWCATMPQGTIIARDKGTVTIMGNTGFDYPELDAIVLLRPTQSISLYMQMLGRGVRPCNGKKHCYMIDITGTVKRLGEIEGFRVEKFEGKWDIISSKGAWHYKKLYSFEIKEK